MPSIVHDQNAADRSAAYLSYLTSLHLGGSGNGQLLKTTVLPPRILAVSPAHPTTLHLLLGAFSSIHIPSSDPAKAFRGQKIVYTSRFVRVILAQGPC